MSNEGKPSNPKDAIVGDKVPLHLVPAAFKALTAIGLAEGRFKYGAWNWRKAGVRASVYLDAHMRHIDDWINGEDHDPETGVHNLANAAACLAIIVDAIYSGQLNDDRPPRQPELGQLLDQKAPGIIAKLRGLFGSRTPKHYTIADSEPVEQHIMPELGRDVRRAELEAALSAAYHKGQRNERIDVV